jgi:ketosteroid isomerase-like protein
MLLACAPAGTGDAAEPGEVAEVAPADDDGAAGELTAADPAAEAIAGMQQEAAVLRALEQAQLAGLAAGSLEEATANYAPDAVMYGPGEPPAIGLEAIREVFAAQLMDPNLSLAFTADRIEVAASADLAVTSGRYRAQASDGGTGRPATSSGRYLTVWRRDPAGDWKIIVDTLYPDPGDSRG